MAKPRKSKSILKSQRQSLQIIFVPIEKITLGNAGRKVDETKVDQLAVSIGDIGLQHPIGVYPLECSPDSYGLAAGQHRLAAIKKLGLKNIPAIVMTRDEAIAWKESENLHRNDLSPLEESISIANYAAARRLLSKADGKRNGGKQPHDEDISGTARALRIDRRRVQRARAHFMLPMSVKKVVLQYNALNKLKILDELAKLKTENEQHSYIRRMVPSARRKERRKSSTEKKRARSRRSLTSGEELSLAIAKGAWRRSGLGNYLSRKSNAVRAAFLRVVSSQN